MMLLGAAFAGSWAIANLFGLGVTGFSVALIGPIALSTLMIAWAGRETRGRSLRELEAE